MRRRCEIAHGSASELQAGLGGNSASAGGVASRVRVDEWKKGLTGIVIGESDPLGAGGKPQTGADFGAMVGRGGKGVWGAGRKTGNSGVGAFSGDAKLT